MERQDVIREAVQAAREFDEREFWKRFTNYDCFGVRITGQDETMLGVVLGDAGEEYGLSLFRGPDAVATLAGLLDSEGQGDDALDDMDMLGFSMEAFGNLPPEAQAFIREAGQRHLFVCYANMDRSPTADAVCMRIVKSHCHNPVTRRNRHEFCN